MTIEEVSEIVEGGFDHQDESGMEGFERGF
jgi:hypothetical protein